MREKRFTPSQIVVDEYEKTYGEPPEVTHFMGAFGTISVWWMQSNVDTRFCTMSPVSKIRWHNGLSVSVRYAIREHARYFNLKPEDVFGLSDEKQQG